MTYSRFIRVGVLATGTALAATAPVYISGAPSTEFRLVTQTSASGAAMAKFSMSASSFSVFQPTSTIFRTPEHLSGVPGRQLHPPVQAPAKTFSRALTHDALLATPLATQAAAQTRFLGVVGASSGRGFDGLTHLDQRSANGGNQYSVEPPNPSIAVANGYILEGVNNAIQVYNLSGQALLPKVISSNELFGVSPAIDRATGVNGVYPTDMRVFYDRDVDRWFVLQRAEDYDVWGNTIMSSHMYLAVSRSGDPTGMYSIYVADTTHGDRPRCPCFSDYPQIGADRYGFYISAGEYMSGSTTFVGATIYAMSKAALAAGEAIPRTFKYEIPFTTGFEFAIQPAVTPPGASYFLGAGGLEYFASTMARSAAGNAFSLWALTNSSALATGIGTPTLMWVGIPTMAYFWPDIATQPPGFRPYGESLIPPGPLPFLDGGDTRMLSLTYAGARLHATLSTVATDSSGKQVVAAAYVVLAPTFRSGILDATVVKQSILAVEGNHILRPAVAVNAQGRGAIAVTLVGPTSWYPTAAYIPIDPVVEPTAVRVARAGVLPEDGFTGYSGSIFPEIARWGDYSTAFTVQDGSVWTVTEYIGPKPRSELANWSTFIAEAKP